MQIGYTKGYPASSLIYIHVEFSISAAHILTHRHISRAFPNITAVTRDRVKHTHTRAHTADTHVCSTYLYYYISNLRGCAGLCTDCMHTVRRERWALVHVVQVAFHGYLNLRAS